MQPGQAITPELVRWQKWPSPAVDASFITRASTTSIEDAVKGTVARMPLIAGQPITNTEIVHANAAGFMAAMLNPGMRAVSITITADTGAGGFILPNDRVDILLTQKLPGEPPRSRARTILGNVRVLAVDQTYKQDKDAKTVIGKTATLELWPSQTELVARAQTQGLISLSLRPLSDDQVGVARNLPAPVSGGLGDGSTSGDSVAIIRYGITRSNEANQSRGQ